eukprot:632477-Ditylum_brightwellii.AAC.1
MKTICRTSSACYDSYTVSPLTAMATYSVVSPSDRIIRTAPLTYQYQAMSKQHWKGSNTHYHRYPRMPHMHMSYPDIKLAHKWRQLKWIGQNLTIDPTMLMALNAIAAEQEHPTSKTAAAIVQLLNYCATHPEATIRYHASGM